MRFDYSKLWWKTCESNVTQEFLASISGMQSTTYQKKMNNSSEFTQSEILCVCNALHIPYEQIHAYFFAPEV